MAVPEDVDPHVLGPGLLPTPFSADEIRAGCPEGRTIRMRVEADGRFVGFRVNVFSRPDAEGATLESRQLDEDGNPAGAPRASRVTWRELQGHAAFEADRTSVESEVLDSPLGRLDCRHYTVTEPDGTVDDFWFAMSAPGMPIRYRSTAGGRVTSEVTVIENSMP
jgi:hypothetical protein